MLKRSRLIEELLALSGPAGETVRTNASLIAEAECPVRIDDLDPRELIETGIRLGKLAYGDFNEPNPGWGEGEILFAFHKDIILFFVGSEERVSHMPPWPIWNS
jgi:hypothetical protein